MEAKEAVVAGFPPVVALVSIAAGGGGLADAIPELLGFLVIAAGKAKQSAAADEPKFVGELALLLQLLEKVVSSAFDLRKVLEG